MENPEFQEETSAQLIPPQNASAASHQPEPVKPPRSRIDSIDLLRGIVMVIMMLEAGGGLY
ncbi:MAG: hypothetical protein ABJB61_13910 [bacterium]